MKKNLKTLAFLSFTCLIIFVLYSFKQKENKAEKEIGYVNKDGKFIAVTDAQLSSFFYKTGHIKQNSKLKKIEVSEFLEKETGKKIYRLITKYMDEDFTLTIGSSLNKINETQYALVGKSCSCKTKACASTAGCDVISTDPCMCSACEDCEKTSTNTEVEEIPGLF